MHSKTLHISEKNLIDLNWILHIHAKTLHKIEVFNTNLYSSHKPWKPCATQLVIFIKKIQIKM
jgi:hypothetical protein